MAELADALDLGSSAARRAGSTPVPGTKKLRRSLTLDAHCRNGSDQVRALSQARWLHRQIDFSHCTCCKP